MAVIAILADFEQGHVFPTFCIAKKLLTRGYRVCYLGVAEAEDVIRKQGFEFRRIVEDVPLASSMSQLRKLSSDNPLARLALDTFIRGKALDDLMLELKPSVVLMTFHYYVLTILIRYRYNVPVILLNTAVVDAPREELCQAVIDYLIDVPSATDLIDLLLSASVEVKNFAEIAALILKMPELVLYPKVFELPGASRDSLVFHVGHEVDLNRVEEPFDWGQLDASRPLIYCSLGSQLDLKSEVSRRFIRTVIHAAAQRPDWQFVVSLGARLSAKEFEPIPPSVILSHWAPQLQMLSRASVMITHAGIGTVKECILHGVPMLALPLMRDQFACTNRIVHHGLGVRGDIEQIEPEELSSMLSQLISNDSFRERVGVMREEFERAEALNLSIKLIEKVIADRLPVNSI